MTDAFWALLGIFIIEMIVLSWLIVRLTVTVSRASSNALASLVAIDARHSQTQRALVDRIISQDWQTVRTYESSEEPSDNGFFAPDDSEVTQEMPQGGLWGSIRTAETSAAALDDALSLAAEDELDLTRAEKDLQS
jgi:hypothetical protein